MTTSSPVIGARARSQHETVDQLLGPGGHGTGGWFQVMVAAKAGVARSARTAAMPAVSASARPANCVIQRRSGFIRHFPYRLCPATILDGPTESAAMLLPPRALSASGVANLLPPVLRVIP